MHAHPSTGIRAMSVAFPEGRRTNDFWHERYPEIIASAERHNLAKVWSADDSTDASRDFDEEMRPYTSDPFRGSVERRILAPGQLPSTLELRAARDVMRAAGLGPEDIGLLIVGSFLPDRIGNGNAAFLARDLGLSGAAWSIESACATVLPALQNACALVSVGAYRHVLIIVSSTYSRVLDPSDTISWFAGDGAGAWLVGPLDEGQGLLGAHLVHTGQTCGAAWYEPTMTDEGEFKAMMRSGAGTGRLFRDLAKPVLVECCLSAIDKAGVSLDDIALFAFNTPTAWYAGFGARCLGVPRERAVNYYERYANIGSALPTTNLYHAAEEGRLSPGDLVLVYCIGSVSSAGAVVMRWGDVGLGPAP